MRVSWGINNRFRLLSLSEWQVPHVLLTRPLLSSPKFRPKTPSQRFSFNLHVLCTPPALILSQDQTLIEILESQFRLYFLLKLLNSKFIDCYLVLKVRATKGDLNTIALETLNVKKIFWFPSTENRSFIALLSMILILSHLVKGKFTLCARVDQSQC